MEVIQVEVDMSHLCNTCRFQHKCLRFKGIDKALDIVEENALDKWRLDVDVDFIVRQCDLYSADMERIQELAEQSIAQAMKHK